jgi:HemY protein
MKQAQLALLDDKPQKALDSIDELDEKQQKHPLAVQLKLQALAKLNEWTALKDLIGRHKKLIADEHLHWAQRATHGEFAETASKHGAHALKEKWQNLSRSARKDVANQVCYVQLLIDQGMSVDAETALIDFANKQTHEAYWGLFKQLSHSSLAPSIRFIEGQIKRAPDKAVLYSVLAHLAYNSGDVDLAQRAINKGLELKKTREDQMLLAAILEKRAAFEEANRVYKSLAIKA